MVMFALLFQFSKKGGQKMSDVKDDGEKAIDTHASVVFPNRRLVPDIDRKENKRPRKNEEKAAGTKISISERMA